MYTFPPDEDLLRFLGSSSVVEIADGGVRSEEVELTCGSSTC